MTIRTEGYRFPDILNEKNLQVGLYGGRDIFHIYSVACRNHYLPDTGTVGCQDFLLQSSDRQDTSGKTDFSRHSHITSRRTFGEEGNDG